MSKWAGLNRRQFPRVKYPCLVVIRNNNSSSDTILTHTENVGIGGVCVILKKDIKMFAPVEIELDLLDFDNHIQCQGKVVWNVQRKTNGSEKPLFYDIGIEFEGLDDVSQKHLNTAIETLIKNNHPII